MSDTLTLLVRSLVSSAVILGDDCWCDVTERREKAAADASS